MREHKTCVHCGSLFYRTYQAKSKWREQRFCSPLCRTSAAVRRSFDEFPKRQCQTCGKGLTPHTTENVAHFGQRRFCNKQCAGMARRKTRPIDLKSA